MRKRSVGRGGQPPGKKEPSSNLEKEERYQQRLQDVGAIDVAERFHHRVVRLCAGGERQVVGDVERQEDHDEGERRHAVGDTQRHRNKARRDPRRRAAVGPQQQRERDRPARDPEPRVGHRIM